MRLFSHNNETNKEKDAELKNRLTELECEEAIINDKKELVELEIA